MFRCPQCFPLATFPLATWLVLLFAACETSEANPDSDPNATHDASLAPSAADASDAGGGPASLDAGTSDANGPAPSLSDAAPNDGRRDAGPGPRSDAGNDAGPQRASDASASDASTSDAGSSDPLSFAAALNMFVDVPCAPNTPTPLATGATCQHPSGTQHIEKAITFGGSKGTVYKVKLRVRGIWEPTKIDGGQRPDMAHPFTIGGMLPPGTGSSDAVSYQQYSVQVAEPKQTYWLNDHQYLAHDIHKEDYQATLQIAGGARVTVIMNDGNDHEIANFTKDFFNDVPPYDKVPSLGQSLRLDVVSVETGP
jgi:hypothetical protein